VARPGRALITPRFPFLAARLGAALLLLAASSEGQPYEASLGAPSDTEELIPLHVPPGSSAGTTHLVRAGERIQDSIDAASSGDLIRIGPGTFIEDIDFAGKALRIVGDRIHTVLQGTGTGPVVAFRDGEGPDSILESLTVTGGSAPSGGGIHIDRASPTIVRTIVTGNRAAAAGSGVWIQGPSSARLYNNLLTYNTTSGGDPHTIQLRDASPAIVNNTIVRGDSNGILVSGSSAPLILNNVIAQNGSRGRGRGICDFSTGNSAIQYNVFHRNRIAALLRDGRDWRSIEAFEAKNAAPDVIGNLDGPPGFFRRPPRRAEKSQPGDFRPGAGARIAEAGHPHPACHDVGGVRNTAGVTGGPFAPGATGLPGAGLCGGP